MRNVRKLLSKTTREIADLEKFMETDDYKKLESDKQELITTRYKAKVAYADLLFKQIIASL
ncbi:hypothetical protein [Limosilactobacillus reuteri]|uniref:Uncharacterized protein n=1 Tax=Limosilactobacillus reuteri TaxID=1598 RepID=A0A256SIE9_LIMRT|nr:hypothetical protein [Limosilactobacillus reuteri]MCC4331520.1 hypothetical protein [Limosilactobacillus reuteri]MCC4354791.1 hypothetical protein [Limosilactobacillus reuteri]MRI08485.1 hypothetical protein [Limosilactobacillus reuteri]OYS66617.1 hypothetical protein CBF96_09970 [Limosilactobacillus reuteri]